TSHDRQVDPSESAESARSIGVLPMPESALLRIEIDEVTPAVIRRVEVPVTIRLDDLHFVLQIAIGWQNCHPFEFRSGETAWGLLDRDNPDASPLAAETATLADLLARGHTF